MTAPAKTFRESLRAFTATVQEKLSAPAAGGPEDQLRAPTEALLRLAGSQFGMSVVSVGETPLPERLGRPDYGVLVGGLLTGHVELKETGKGTTPNRFTGHDRRQWDRFRLLPNLLYSDGNEWALFRNGELVRRVRLARDVRETGPATVDSSGADALLALLGDFFAWEPVVPTSAADLAALLAPLCRNLRSDVADAIRDDRSPLVQLVADWKQLLFPDADHDQFADAYAQTVVFALLLARSEGADALNIDDAVARLAAAHTLLSRALQVLTDPAARSEITASLELVQRVVAVVSPEAMARRPGEDPWLYFYEDFLEAYDADLRRNAGVYYTPVEVVHAQVRLIDRLLVGPLGRPLGFADRDVVSLDPAVGTGTYLLGIIEHALSQVEDRFGPGAVPAYAEQLGKNLFGFEVMVGPYAVAELRVSRALTDRGASLPTDVPGVYLTDTLESPFTEPPAPPLFLKPLADQHQRALTIKDRTLVLVCLGNPPYDRHPAAEHGEGGGRGRTGGWVRYGNRIDTAPPILEAFIEPAVAAGLGGQLKNIYNLYVYFWRWALWKVFEHVPATGPGVVSFISASSYLFGPGFVGIREHMRRVCDEVWVIDVGGELRGTRKSENVFAIQTPVAIVVAVRHGTVNRDSPAAVRYARIEGTRQQKLAALDEISRFEDVTWRDCPIEWQAPFVPAGVGQYFEWPLLTDLLPYSHSGVKAGRTWVIAPDTETLSRRWDALMAASGEGRRRLFKDSPSGRKVTDTPQELPPRARDKELVSISRLPHGSPLPAVERYSFRSLDRQFIVADPRMIDRPGPSLWRIRGEHQVFLTTLLNHPLGHGPAVMAAAWVPDLHHFRGSFGAREVMPLYRSADRSTPNVTGGLLERLSRQYGVEVSAEAFFAYLYAILCNPVFTETFWIELEGRELRVPITTDRALFERCVEVGRRLVWLHTFAERFDNEELRRGAIRAGTARCATAVPTGPEHHPEEFHFDPATLQLVVGAGLFSPVSEAAWNFEVSGFKVVESWLASRMRKGRGRTSSELDRIRPEGWPAALTQDLLELLWVIEDTLLVNDRQAALLEEVRSLPTLGSEGLPAPSAAERRTDARRSLFKDEPDDEFSEGDEDGD